MNIDNNDKNIEFSDSICTCKECDHNMSKDCFNFCDRSKKRRPFYGDEWI